MQGEGLSPQVLVQLLLPVSVYSYSGLYGHDKAVGPIPQPTMLVAKLVNARTSKVLEDDKAPLIGSNPIQHIVKLVGARYYAKAPT